MLSTMRQKFGPAIVGTIVGFIAFVFVFEFGVNRGGGGGSASSAGSVNGEVITVSEFNRELHRRMEFFKSMGGGALTEEQIQQFGIRDSVFREMVNRKLMIQEAKKQHLLPSDAEVRQQIVEIPEFKKDGRFDRTHYLQLLAANQYTPGGFETMVRESLVSEVWRNYFRSLARYSEEEIKREFTQANDKRKIRYVLLNVESGKKLVKISPQEVDKVLADAAKLNLLKTRYEAGKKIKFKDQTFDQAKPLLAKDLVQEEKSAEGRKVVEELGDKVMAALTQDPKSDGAVNAILKGIDLKVSTSQALGRGNFFIPGAGEAKAIQADAFAEQSPIQSKAKKYSLPSGVVVAVLAGKETPDLSKLDGKEREAIIQRIVSRKEGELYSDWIKRLTDRAKIKRNDAVFGKSARTEDA